MKDNSSNCSSRSHGTIFWVLSLV